MPVGLWILRLVVSNMLDVELCPDGCSGESPRARLQGQKGGPADRQVWVASTRSGPAEAGREAERDRGDEGRKQARHLFAPRAAVSFFGSLPVISVRLPLGSKTTT